MLGPAMVWGLPPPADSHNAVFPILPLTPFGTSPLDVQLPLRVLPGVHYVHLNFVFLTDGHGLILGFN